MEINGSDEVVPCAMVSGNYYAVLGIEPILGRLLEPADDAVLGVSIGP